MEYTDPISYLDDDSYNYFFDKNYNHIIIKIKTRTEMTIIIGLI